MPFAVVGELVLAEVAAAALEAAIVDALATAALETFLVGLATSIGESLLGSVISGLVTSALKGSSSDKTSANASAVQSRIINSRQAITPWDIVYGQVRKGGAVTYIEVVNGKLFIVVTLAGHNLSEIGDIYFGDELVPLDGSDPNGGGVPTSGSFVGFARILKSLGDEAGQPFQPLVDASAGLWTDAHRQSGHGKICIILDFSATVYPNGIPNVTAVVKGRKVYDPRSTLTVYSNNAALCVADYLTNTDFGFGAVYADEIDEAQLISAANSCDEAVSIAAGGTEARYTVNGVANTDSQPKDILGYMLAACAGKVVNVGGRWEVFVGVYEAPTITLDEGNLVGNLTIQSLISRRDNANSIKGLFTDPSSFWQPTSFAPLQSSTYIAEDNGEQVWKELDLTTFVTSGSQCQRLAKLELLSLRQALSITADFNLSAWRVMTGRTVAITNTKYGWTAKPFEILQSSFNVNDDGTLVISMTLRETAAAIFDWATSEEQVVDLAPNSNLPDPFANLTVSGQMATDALFIQPDGTGVPRILLSWSVVTNPFVNRYQMQFAPAGGSAWQDCPAVLAPSLQGYIFPVQNGAAYDIRVRAGTTLGNFGGWSYIYAHTVDIASAPPDNVTGLTATANPLGVTISWNDVADPALLDYEVRVGTSWAAGVLVGRAGGTSLTVPPLVAGNTTYWIVARSTELVESVTPASYTFTATGPGTPAATVAFSGSQGSLSWAAVSSMFAIDRYEIRYGTTWASALQLGTSPGLSFALPPVTYVGSGTYLVVAWDIAGNMSAVDNTGVTILAAAAPSLTTQVIDNNVLLFWSAVQGTLPTATYEVREGATYGTSVLKGNKSGGFTSLAETSGGSYTYWVTAIDTAGNYGTPASVTAVVGVVPNYVLRSNQNSTFNGTLTHALLQGGTLTLPVDTAETFAQHFELKGGSPSWTKPDDQINAGYPIYIEPVPSTASYVEIIDFGATLPSSQITVAITQSIIAGSPGTQLDIATSPDGSPGPIWTTYTNTNSVFATSFRYVRLTYTVTSSTGKDVLNVSAINTRLDVKLKNDGGKITANAADAGGTAVSFNVAFVDVESIVLTLMGAASNYNAVTDFVSVPSPTGFNVFLFNSAGVRQSGTVGWAASGY